VRVFQGLPRPSGTRCPPFPTTSLGSLRTSPPLDTPQSPLYHSWNLTSTTCHSRPVTCSSEAQPVQDGPLAAHRVPILKPCPTTASPRAHPHPALRLPLHAHAHLPRNRAGLWRSRAHYQRSAWEISQWPVRRSAISRLGRVWRCRVGFVVEAEGAEPRRGNTTGGGAARCERSGGPWAVRNQTHRRWERSIRQETRTEWQTDYMLIESSPTIFKHSLYAHTQDPSQLWHTPESSTPPCAPGERWWRRELADVIDKHRFSSGCRSTSAPPRFTHRGSARSPRSTSPHWVHGLCCAKGSLSIPREDSGRSRADLRTRPRRSVRRSHQAWVCVGADVCISPTSSQLARSR
jgi:hypothetical protein